MNMSYSNNGLNLIKEFEQCRLMPYKDGGGVWTDGWGNTHRVRPGVAITQEKADSDLMANVQDAVDAVNDHVTVTLTQSQFDALVVFVFNIGTPQFKTSTLLRKLNTGDYQGAHDQLDRWNMDNGKVVNGLIRRRDAEQALWSSEIVAKTIEIVPEVVVEAIQEVPANQPHPAMTFIMAIFKAILGAFKK